MKTTTSTQEVSANEISSDTPEGKQEDQASREAGFDPELEMVVMGLSKANGPRRELDGLKTREEIAITPKARS